MIGPGGALQLAAISFLAVMAIAATGYVARFGLPGAETQVGRATSRAARLTASLATPMRPEGRADVQRLLAQAGYRADSAPYLYALSRASLAIGLPALAVSLVRSDSVVGTATLIAGGLAIGLYLPQAWVNRRRRIRITEIREGLPQMMEYTLPLLEAGHTVDGTLRQLVPSLSHVAPSIATELARTTQLIDAGVPREEALDGIEALSGVSELESILRLMARAERSGASLLETMRQTAADARQQQLRRTEAAMASNRPIMTVVAVLFNLPLLIVLLVGPAVLDGIGDISDRDTPTERR